MSKHKKSKSKHSSSHEGSFDGCLRCCSWWGQSLGLPFLVSGFLREAVPWIVTGGCIFSSPSRKLRDMGWTGTSNFDLYIVAPSQIMFTHFLFQQASLSVFVVSTKILFTESPKIRNSKVSDFQKEGLPSPCSSIQKHKQEL